MVDTEDIVERIIGEDRKTDVVGKVLNKIQKVEKDDDTKNCKY